MISEDEFIAMAFLFGHKLTLIGDDNRLPTALVEKNQRLRDLLRDEGCPLDEMTALAERHLLEKPLSNKRLTVSASLDSISQSIGSISQDRLKIILDIAQSILKDALDFHKRSRSDFFPGAYWFKLQEAFHRGLPWQPKKTPAAPESGGPGDPFAAPPDIHSRLRTKSRAPRVHIPVDFLESIPTEQRSTHDGAIPKAAEPPDSDDFYTLAGPPAASAAEPEPPAADRPGGQSGAEAAAEAAVVAHRPGRAFFNPPKTMWVGISEPIELRIRAHHVLSDEEIQAIRNTMHGEGEPRDEIIPRIGARMAAQLFADDEYVTITEMGTREQDLTLKGITHWDWSVRPLRPGEITLILRLTLRRDLLGRELETDLEALRSEIRIRVKSIWAYPARFWRKHWQWAVGTMLGIPALIGSVLALL